MPEHDVLLVLPEPPLPFGGAAARWYHVLLQRLEREGRRVVLFVSCDSATAARDAVDAHTTPNCVVRAHVREQGGGLLSRLRSLHAPFSYQFSRALRDDLRDHIRQGYREIRLEQLWSLYALPPGTPRATVNVHYLLDIDCSQDRGGTLRDRMLRHAALRAERRLLRRSTRITALTDRLANRIRQINPRAEVTVQPMALDLSLYSFELPPDRWPPTVGLIGSFNWGPTLQAGRRLVERIWPLIRAEIPEARLLIVGRRAAEAFADVRDTPGLELHSDVPDTLPFFRQLDVMIYAPGVGSGMKVKVMEAMALGVPVVTNEEGVEGLSASGPLAASDDRSLSRCALALLLDQPAREQCASAQRQSLLVGSANIPARSEFAR